MRLPATVANPVSNIIIENSKAIRRNKKQIGAEIIPLTTAHHARITKALALEDEFLSDL